MSNDKLLWGSHKLSNDCRKAIFGKNVVEVARIFSGRPIFPPISNKQLLGSFNALSPFFEPLQVRKDCLSTPKLEGVENVVGRI